MTTKEVKYKANSNSYKFKKNKNIKFKEVNYPEDKSQIPDIIVTIKSVKFFGQEWNVGYFRVKAADCFKNTSPKWIKFKSIDNPHTSPGKLLCNFLLANKNTDTYRPMKKMLESEFNLYMYLFYSLDIAPDTREDKIKTYIKYNYGKEDFKTAKMDGHNPIWDHEFSKKIQMPKDLSFAPGMSLTLTKEGRFYGEDEIGEIFIQMDRIKEKPKRPRFYQFYSNDGRSVGKLLAIFFINEHHKDK